MVIKMSWGYVLPVNGLLDSIGRVVVSKYQFTHHTETSLESCSGLISHRVYESLAAIDSKAKWKVG